MKFNIKVVVILSFLLQGFLFASIERKDENTELSKKTVSIVYNVSSEDNNLNGLFPDYLLQVSRSADSMFSFYTLPKNVLLTLEQSYLTVFNKKDSKLGMSVVTLNNTNRHVRSAAWVDYSKNFDSSFGSVETYLETKNNDNEDIVSSVGAKISSKISNLHLDGEILFENISSPAVKATLRSLYKFDTSINSMLAVAFQYAGENEKADSVSSFAKDQITATTLFAPVHSNISTFNIALTCLPKKNTFMSVEYFYYLQNKIQVQNFSHDDTYFMNALTNGMNSFLGQELNFKAIRTCSNNWKSELFAGWFDPGEAYSNTDDNKTFEIRGEIVVNF